MNINRIYLNLRQMSSKNYAIFFGGGGEVIKRSHWITGGRGGGQDGPKKDQIIFERSLRCFRLAFNAVKSKGGVLIESCQMSAPISTICMLPLLTSLQFQVVV